MNSTFTGLSIATRGLFTSQAGLAVTSNNISNVNTAGYTRQTIIQTAITPAAVYSSSALLGAGSQVASIDQVRNAQLDVKYRREHALTGEWEVRANILTELETVIGDTTDGGLSAIIEEFYAALEDLSADPASTAARTVVKETGNSLCQYLNSTARQLNELRADINNDIKTAIESLNSYAEQIAELNKQIQAAIATGSAIHDLTDRRNLLLDELASLASIDVTTADSMVSVTINGVSLVNGNQVRQLEVYEITGGSQDEMYGIRWLDTQEAFSPGGGEVQALLAVRDGLGTGSDYKGIPYYIDQLDEYARTFAQAFNEGLTDNSTVYSGHADGIGADGTTGIRFFTYDGKSSGELMTGSSDTASIYAHITAANISLAQEVQEDVNKIAAASAADESGNSEVVADLISLCKSSAIFSSGTAEDFLNSIISTLGSDSSFAQRQADRHSSILTNIENRRSSVSGVSTNEESANLTKYQQAYEASAKVIGVWDEIYRETINIVSDD